jgi:hypothetical protein
MANAVKDGNFVSTLIAVDDSVFITPVLLAANATTHALLVEGNTGASAGQVQGTAASGATATGNPVQQGGVYNTSAPTLTNGQAGAIQLDVNANEKVVEQYVATAEDNVNGVIAVQIKPTAASTYAPSVYAPLTQVTKNVIKASTGNVFSVYISNDNATVRYFQFHNKATAPAGTDVPVISIKVPAGTANNPGSVILDDAFFTKAGMNFATGIGWAISTTFGTFTDSATNTEHIVIVHYK